MAIAWYTTRSGENKPDPWTEEVNGTVIGDFTSPYEFWMRDGSRMIARGSFENDDQAVLWFKTNYPQEFSTGAEMRVF